MALRNRRVVRPMASLPRGKRVSAPVDGPLPSLREFLATLVRERRDAEGPDSIMNVGSVNVVEPLKFGTYPVFTPISLPGVTSASAFVARDIGDLGPALWPKTFDLRYDNFADRMDRSAPIEMQSDYNMSRTLHDPSYEFAYVQSVTIDPKTKIVGARVSRAIIITPTFREQICRQSVRHKIFALSTLTGGLKFFPISTPHSRLIRLLQLFTERYRQYPKSIVDRVGEYERE